MKQLMIIVMVLFSISVLSAQEIDTIERTQNDNELPVDSIPVGDGFYHTMNYTAAKPLPLPKVEERNIRFYKRVWRDIDVKNPKNAILAVRGNSLIEAIMEGIKTGKLTPYSPQDDAFETRLSARDGLGVFQDTVLVPVFDDEGNQLESKKALNEFNPERVTKYRIKEDIFFDKQRGRLERRIIALAPLINTPTSIDVREDIGAAPAFWLYFPQLRYVLVQKDIADPEKGWFDMTMDDLFLQNKFAAEIVRESVPGKESSSQELSDKTLDDQLDEYRERLWKNPKGVNPDELLTPNDSTKAKR